MLKKILMVLLFVLGAQSHAENSHQKVIGPVEDFFCGEIDSQVIGETCIIFIKDIGGQKYAFLLNFDGAVEHSEELESLVGRSRLLTIAWENIELLHDEQIKVLKHYRTEPSYFYFKAPVQDILE